MHIRVSLFLSLYTQIINIFVWCERESVKWNVRASKRSEQATASNSFHQYRSASRFLIGCILSVFFVRYTNRPKYGWLVFMSVCSYLFRSRQASDISGIDVTILPTFFFFFFLFHYGLTVLCVGTGTLFCMFVCQWCDYDTKQKEKNKKKKIQNV